MVGDWGGKGMVYDQNGRGPLRPWTKTAADWNGRRPIRPHDQIFPFSCSWPLI